MNKEYFKFESSDSHTQFILWMMPILGGGILSILAFDHGGILAVSILIITIILLIVGLRTSIEINNKGVIVKKKWFFVPYMAYKSDVVDDVWFAGDYGLEDGAMGVVVRLGEKEIAIGTSKNMHFLFNNILPFTKKTKRLHNGG